MKSHTDLILDYPIQNALTTPLRKEAAKQNCPDFLSMWAGQGAHLCKEIPVAQLIKELDAGMKLLLKHSAQ